MRLTTKRRAVSILAGSALAAGLAIAAAAAPASAATAASGAAPAGLSACDVNYVCLWTGINFTGSFYEWPADQLKQGEWSVPGQRSASAYNRTNGTFCTFNIDSTIQTNKLLGHTEGNLANLTTDWVGPCKH